MTQGQTKKPSRTPSRLVLLASSNATNKYIANALTFLSWPRGWVAHARYQIKWIDDDLSKQLPSRVEVASGNRSPLMGRRVLTAYMYQERISATETKRLALYPLRYAILRQAYRLGRTSADIAHFYFELEGFYVPPNGATVLDPLEVLGAKAHVREIDFDVNASSPI